MCVCPLSLSLLPRETFHSTLHRTHRLYVPVAKIFVVADHRKRDVPWIAQTGHALQMCRRHLRFSTRTHAAIFYYVLFIRTHAAIFRSFSDSAAADSDCMPCAVQEKSHGSLDHSVFLFFDCSWLAAMREVGFSICANAVWRHRQVCRVFFT